MVLTKLKKKLIFLRKIKVMLMGIFTKSDVDKKLQEANNEIKLLKSILEKYNKPNARGAGRKGRMTEEDKQKITELREEGISYNKIATKLNLPVGTVFNYAKTIENSQDAISNKIKKITESIKIETLPTSDSVDFNNFLELSKYRQLMNHKNENK
jgi:hypothetical protein